jgi:protein-disulfide isomerase
MLGAFSSATTPRLSSVVVAAAVLAVGSLPPAALASDPEVVVATVGSERITEADVAAADRAEFEKLEAEYGLKLRQLKLRQSQARHELLQQQLEKLLDRRALELEAKARGVKPAVVLADIKVPDVTEEETRRFYEENKSRTSESFEQLQLEIIRHLAHEHNDDATRDFYSALRARHGITALLDPYRLTVDATGPSRGKADAPVTIVEFADFQCPYCREAEDALHRIMSRHPDEVRLVFHNMPFPSLHPNAIVAAEAGVCAERQGMFWPMHDAMFENQKALSEGALKDTARRLGLQVQGFSACLADPGTNGKLDADKKAAEELNVTGTPYFFINGRPVYGSVPPERFESIISDELRRIGARRVAAKGG